MYCPQCRVEYRDGFTECSDCRVALLPGLAPASPESRLDLVTVFESNDGFAIALAKGSLEDSCIPFWMDGDETAARLVLGPIMFPSCRFGLARALRPPSYGPPTRPRARHPRGPAQAPNIALD